MKGCPHDKLEFLGKERGNGDVNLYYICKKCGGVIVFTKERKVYSVTPSEKQK